jgi:hypothetical protein
MAPIDPGSSMEMATSESPCSRYVLCSRTSAGNSSRQGSHHVAQKFTSSTRPRCRSRSACHPSSFRLVIAAGGGGSGGTDDRAHAAANVSSGTSGICRPIEVTRDTVSELPALDRAPEGLGLRACSATSAAGSDWLALMPTTATAFLPLNSKSARGFPLPASGRVKSAIFSPILILAAGRSPAVHPLQPRNSPRAVAESNLRLQVSILTSRK